MNVSELTGIQSQTITKEAVDFSKVMPALRKLHNGMKLPSNQVGAVTTPVNEAVLKILRKTLGNIGETKGLKKLTSGVIDLTEGKPLGSNLEILGRKSLNNNGLNSKGTRQLKGFMNLQRESMRNVINQKGSMLADPKAPFSHLGRNAELINNAARNRPDLQRQQFDGIVDFFSNRFGISREDVIAKIMSRY